MSAMWEAAARYVQDGMSVIPVSQEKRPLLPAWKSFQYRLPMIEELVVWERRHPAANIGIVTGAVSGIVVLDIDGIAGMTIFDEFVDYHHSGILYTPMVQTPRGVHVYFKHPGRETPNASRRSSQIDLRGDGGYVVAPPSVIDSNTYVWVEGRRLDECSFKPMPAWVDSIFGRS